MYVSAVRDSSFAQQACGLSCDLWNLAQTSLPEARLHLTMSCVHVVANVRMQSFICNQTFLHA